MLALGYGGSCGVFRFYTPIRRLRWSHTRTIVSGGWARVLGGGVVFWGGEVVVLGVEVVVLGGEVVYSVEVWWLWWPSSGGHGDHGVRGEEFVGK